MKLFGLLNQEKKKDKYPDIKINNHNLKNSLHFKYLGLNIQSGLNWNIHMEELKRKSQNGLNIMKAISRVWWGVILRHFY